MMLRTVILRSAPLLVVLGALACESLTDDEATRAREQNVSVTASFQKGVVPTSSYSGVLDATLDQNNAATNFGAAATCNLDGDDGSGGDLACAIRWDVSSIPPGSVVESVTITLRIVDSSSNTYNVYALSRAFVEAEATWQRASATTLWASPGAQGQSDRGALVGTVSGSNGSKTVTLNAAGVAMVQGWVDGGTNAGIMMAHPSNTNGLDLASSQHGTAGYRPRLNVTYQTATGGGSGGATSGGATSGGATSGGATSGGATSGGATSGGASSGGSSGGAGVPTEPNLLIAFLGDQGNNSNADSVLNLVKNEGAEAVVHNGDFDYADNPQAFESRINAILGQNYPYFAVIGNHDAARWSGASGYANFIQARAARAPGMQCTGELGVKANCTFKGLHLVESCVGTSELRSSCGKDSSEQVTFIKDSLGSSQAIWSICNWHKNQRDMQVGDKTDEVGWNAYKECQAAGALIMTGHEHSYSRTLTLTNVGNAAQGHGKTGSHTLIDLSPGRTVAIVSGLGGVGIRPFSTTHNSDTWWSTYATSDRWMLHGVQQSGAAGYGALFVRFNVDGDPRKATAYFKDTGGRILDTFTLSTR